MWKRPLLQHALTYRNITSGIPPRPSVEITTTRNSTSHFHHFGPGKERAEGTALMAGDQRINELVESAEGGSRGGKLNSRGRGGKGNGARGEGREVAISKALSKLLRHAAEDEGLVLDGEGFGRLDQVVSLVLFSAVCFSFPSS